MKNIFYPLLFFATFASCKILKQSSPTSPNQEITTTNGGQDEQSIATVTAYSAKTGESSPGITREQLLVDSLRPNGPDNFNFLQKLIDNTPTQETIYLPSGVFNFSKTLTISKSIRLMGTWNTKLVFQNGVAGINVRPGSKVFIKDLDIHSVGGSRAKPSNGITINGITHVENVNVLRFSGDGIHISADIHVDGANASQSTFRNVEVIECMGNGFFMRGGDANGMGFYSCSARDNGGIGFYDHSFLGNSFFNCMGHANAKGHYKCDDLNARSVFVGCYGEEDSPPSSFGGVAYVFGGLLGYEIIKKDGKYFYKDGKPYRGSGGYQIASPYAKVSTQ